MTRFFMRRFFFVSILAFFVASINLLTGDEITADNFAKAALYSRTHGGLGVRVESGGHLIFEDYARGFSASTSHRIF